MKKQATDCNELFTIQSDNGLVSRMHFEKNKTLITQ